MRRIWFVLVCSLTCSESNAADDELALFSGNGEAAAYVALDDELTIYLWGGKPVAYLEEAGDGGYHVYGFNGKHLAWFARGVVWDHRGDAACATKEKESVDAIRALQGLQAVQTIQSLQAICASAAALF